MRRALLLFCLFFCWVGGASAALDFPALSGRVVDEAKILSPLAKHTLTEELAAYERVTGRQIVVATLRSLRGTSIEDYGVALGRAWKIGQKDVNNGILFLIAPNERQVRIEVGYGNEGVLTDAASSLIIQKIVLPAFRKGSFETGTVEGAREIIKVLEGNSPLLKGTAVKDIEAGENPAQESIGSSGFVALFLGVVFLAVLLRVFFGFSLLDILALLAVFSGGGRGRGGGDDDSFGGGGGSFGGGGASGKW